MSNLEAITIPTEVWENLAKTVKFTSAVDQRKYIADAMNTYVQLAQMAEAGCKILVKRPEGSEAPKDYVNVVLPFQSSDAEAAQSASANASS